MKKNKIFKYVFFTIIMIFSNILIVNALGNDYVTCGNVSFPAPLAPMIRTTVLLLQVIAPIVIILAGSMDFLKAVVAKNAEEMKKNEKQFVNRLVAGGIVFFVITIAKIVVSLAASDMNKHGIDEANLTRCIDCLINDELSCGSKTNTNPFGNVED